MPSHRKKDDNRRKAEGAAVRRRRTWEILNLLGLWNGVGKKFFEPMLTSLHYPRVEVSLASDTPKSDKTKSLLRQMDKVVRRATFDCPIMGEDFSTTDYFSFVKPVMDALLPHEKYSEECRRFLSSAREQTRELAAVETAATAILELLKELEDVLVKEGRIDQQLYHLELEYGRNESRRYFVRFVLKVEDHRKLWLEPKMGEGRWAYACGQPFGWCGINWVDWNPSILGIQNESRSYPVYVQRHALDSLYRRADIVENGEWLLHDYLWQSLRDPKVTPMTRDPSKYLVEYSLSGHRLGYLVAQPTGGVVLIETFLFLTMDGTPEGELLRKNLRLSRPDKKYLELDQIRTFLMTDIQFDCELVSILEKCGCGHLFRVLEDPPRHRCVPGYAEELRKYLRLGG